MSISPLGLKELLLDGVDNVDAFEDASLLLDVGNIGASHIVDRVVHDLKVERWPAGRTSPAVDNALAAGVVHLLLPQFTTGPPLVLLAAALLLLVPSGLGSVAFG